MVESRVAAPHRFKNIGQGAKQKSFQLIALILKQLRSSLIPMFVMRLSTDHIFHSTHVSTMKKEMTRLSLWEKESCNERVNQRSI